jgi:hypothetical protein
VNSQIIDVGMWEGRSKKEGFVTMLESGSDSSLARRLADAPPYRLYGR